MHLPYYCSFITKLLYSQTSFNGPSEKRTTTLQRTNKTTDGFPIEHCILGASEMRTFQVPDNGQTLLLHHTKSVSLNGHSLTHIKIYYSSDNFLRSTEAV